MSRHTLYVCIMCVCFLFLVHVSWWKLDGYVNELHISREKSLKESHRGMFVVLHHVNLKHEDFCTKSAKCLFSAVTSEL